MTRYLEFLESSVFSRRLPEYLGDDDYRQLQSELAGNPEMGDLMPVLVDFVRCAGQIRDAARGEEVDCV